MLCKILDSIYKIPPLQSWCNLILWKSITLFYTCFIQPREQQQKNSKNIPPITGAKSMTKEQRIIKVERALE